MKLSVIALIATCGRPGELARLLNSMAAIEKGLALVVVVDNGGSPEVQAVVEAAHFSTHYVNPGKNLGCGGGLRLAGQRAMELAGTIGTHFLILDDDAVLAGDTLAVLAAAMESASADLAYPLVVDAQGHVGWTPGVAGVSGAMERAPGLTPEQFRQRFGAEPRDFLWAQGICLLVARRAVEKCGWHRDDFWVRGEDLEFSLRLTAQGRGIFVPTAVVEHRPPANTEATSREAEYWRHSALLQNIAYVGFRLPHGRRIAWTILGALRHYCRVWGARRAAKDALRALWHGAIQGLPAGRGSGDTFRERCAAVGGRTP